MAASGGFQSFNLIGTSARRSLQVFFLGDAAREVSQFSWHILRTNRVKDCYTLSVLLLRSKGIGPAFTRGLALATRLIALVEKV